MRWSSLWVALGLVVAAVGGASAQEDYEIGPGDTLGVVVLGQSGMSGDFPVGPEGLIGFPFLGKVKVAGMTPREVERKLTTLLSDGYLKKPQVSVAVKEYGSQRVWVIGEIPKPGPYSLKGDRTLRALFESLGDIGPQVGHEIIVIRPPLQGGGDVDAPTSVPIPPEQAKAAGAEVFRVSLRELRWGNPEKNMALQAGDTIFFPKPAQINVMGNVARAGSFKFEEGLTVQEVINLAGGITAKGSWKGVHIFRFVDGGQKKISPKMEDVVVGIARPRSTPWQRIAALPPVDDTAARRPRTRSSRARGTAGPG